MTYQINVPNSAQSPGLWPLQGNDNFIRIKTIIASNHKFNDTAASDDGCHQDIQILPIAPPGNTTIGAGQLYIDSADNQLKFKKNTNEIYQISPCYAVRVSVIFKPGSPNAVILASYNVSSVTQQGGGTYKINFSTNTPSNNYYPCLSIIPTSSSNSIMVTGRSLTDTTTSSFQVVARQSSGSANDSFGYISVILYGG